MWESDKSHQCWADQTEEGSRGKSVLVFGEGHCIQMCAGLWSKLEGKFRESCPLPLEASIATWERLQNVISRNRWYPGVCSRIQNIKCSCIFQDFFFLMGGRIVERITAILSVLGIFVWCNAMQIQHSVLPEQSCNLMRKIPNFILLYFFSW